MRVRRRDFIAALFAPFVAKFLPKVKEPLIQFIEIRPSMASDWYGMADSLSKRFPGREFFNVEGQHLFPSYTADGKPKYAYSAFLLAPDWKNRKKEYPDGGMMPTQPDYVIYA